MEAQVGDMGCAERVQDTLESETSATKNRPQHTEHGPHECGSAQVLDKSSPEQMKLECQELSVTAQFAYNSPPAQNLPRAEDQNQSEEFIIFDQNGKPLHCERMVIVTGQSDSGQLYVIPSNHFGGAQVLLPQGQIMDIAESAGPCGEKSSVEQPQTITVTAIADSTSGSTLLTPSPVTATKTPPQSSPDHYAEPLKTLPPNAPSWTHLLHNCEKIGDSYRGYCTTEGELEALLMLHKQHTHSVFGTRQSPSPAKPATRLMWKSQYVPYDGIPFINAGSRAIVMECQFGPRRKGVQPKKMAEQEICPSTQYKATCPARIYIKKVRKFPEYRVPTDPKVDKKVVRQEQEKAFFNLKKGLWEASGVLRYYIQLPTTKAHLYHHVDAPVLPPLPVQLLLPKEEEQEEEEEEEDREGACEGGEGGALENGSCTPSRLHPRVAEKIHELVAQGHHQVYTVRKQLRKFVEREMFKSDKVPERHNLCYFPTVNDIKNHIHEAQKALQQGRAEYSTNATDSQWTAGADSPLAETVTLTLAPTTVEVNPQRTEVLEGSETLSPEAMQLFSSLTSLQPKIFAQLHGVQLQPALCSTDKPLPQQPVALPSSSLCRASDPSSTAQSQPLLLGSTQFLPPPACLGEGMALSDAPALLGVGQLVSVSALGEGAAEGRVHQILLEDGNTIPVQIVDPVSTVRSPEDQTQEIETEDGRINPTQSQTD
ncbi:calcium-responsive transcription factor [Megalops cyprinoides]|uniref:calcium-responsive transcription factor n=1 Tax=Megalops cyprinoides TaxID=118141 RepID=UPI0018645BB8|nr:calcium-responsive transcription factor [Megalops cyprinoides]XP_036396901.1 calcium-responsive transcription factor [Megalops cyprinoides]